MGTQTMTGVLNGTLTSLFWPVTWTCSGWPRPRIPGDLFVWLERSLNVTRHGVMTPLRIFFCLVGSGTACSWCAWRICTRRSQAVSWSTRLWLVNPAWWRTTMLSCWSSSRPRASAGPALWRGCMLSGKPWVSTPERGSSTVYHHILLLLLFNALQYFWHGSDQNCTLLPFAPRQWLWVFVKPACVNKYFFFKW